MDQYAFGPVFPEYAMTTVEGCETRKLSQSCPKCGVHVSPTLEYSGAAAQIHQVHGGIPNALTGINVLFAMSLYLYSNASPCPSKMSFVEAVLGGESSLDIECVDANA